MKLKSEAVLYHLKHVAGGRNDRSPKRIVNVDDFILDGLQACTDLICETQTDQKAWLRFVTCHVHHILFYWRFWRAFTIVEKNRQILLNYEWNYRSCKITTARPKRKKKDSVVYWSVGVRWSVYKVMLYKGLLVGLGLTWLLRQQDNELQDKNEKNNIVLFSTYYYI